jgi:membrane-associated phospholipid phosphatase
MSAKAQRLLAIRVSAAAFVMLAFLTAAVCAGTTMPFDNLIRSTVHENAAPYLTSIAMGASFMGRLAVLIPATVVLVTGFFLVGRRSAGVALATVMAGAAVLNWVLKVTVHRPRPSPFYGVDPESFSFPSGHAFFALSFWGALLLILAGYRKVSPLALATGTVLVLAIAWSRIYLGVHYPTDVAGGLLVAICWLGALFGLGLFGVKTVPR